MDQDSDQRAAKKRRKKAAEADRQRQLTIARMNVRAARAREARQRRRFWLAVALILDLVERGKRIFGAALVHALTRPSPSAAPVDLPSSEPWDRDYAPHAGQAHQEAYDGLDFRKVLQHRADRRVKIPGMPDRYAYGRPSLHTLVVDITRPVASDDAWPLLVAMTPPDTHDLIREAKATGDGRALQRCLADGQRKDDEIIEALKVAAHRRRDALAEIELEKAERLRAAIRGEKNEEQIPNSDADR